MRHLLFLAPPAFRFALKRVCPARRGFAAGPPKSFGASPARARPPGGRLAQAAEKYASRARPCSPARRLLPFAGPALAAALLCLPPPAFSLRESDIKEVYDLLSRRAPAPAERREGKSGRKSAGLYYIGKIPGRHGLNLRYLKFGKRRGENGSIAFINGRGENLLKYLELFYDLSLQGWSPIYTYDHRGQGFSDRVLPPSVLERDIGYVENYKGYRADMAAFARLVSSDPDFHREKGFLIAHSMGGVIAADYLGLNSDQKIFQAAALSSPMFRILSHQPPFMERALLAMIKIYCRFGGCLEPVFEVDLKRSKQEQRTGSLARFGFSEAIERQFPEARLGRPSFHWVLESFRATEALMEERRAGPAPLLILQAEREYLVSNPHQDQFCQSLPAGCCKIQKIPGRHEHFMETDEYRDMAIKETLRFFSEYKSHRAACESEGQRQPPQTASKRTHKL